MIVGYLEVKEKNRGILNCFFLWIYDLMIYLGKDAFDIFDLLKKVSYC